MSFRSFKNTELGADLNLSTFSVDSLSSRVVDSTDIFTDTTGGFFIYFDENGVSWSKDLVDWLSVEKLSTVEKIITGNQKILGIGQNNGAYFTLGGDGYWQKQDVIGAPVSPNRFGFFKDKFVVGEGSRSYVSTDAKYWEKSSSIPISSTQNFVTSPDLIIVNESFGDEIAVSTDGLSWQLAAGEQAYDWNAGTYGNGLFVIIGEYSSKESPYNVQVSTNGFNWVGGYTGEQSHDRITFGNGIFVAKTSIYDVSVSTDGLNWTTHALPQYSAWTGLEYGNGLFVMVDPYNQYVYSTNGTNWTFGGSPNARQNLVFGDSVTLKYLLNSIV